MTEYEGEKSLLKFDIQFLGVPANIITVNCRWK